MASETVRPSDTIDPGDSVPSGGASLDAVTADGLDSTYFVLGSDPATIAFDAPATPGIIGANLRIRCNGVGHGGPVTVATNGDTPYLSRQGVNWGLKGEIFFPSGFALLAADALDNDDPQIVIGGGAGDLGELRVYAMYLDFVTVDPATVFITSPGGTLTDTNLPEVAWLAVLDPDGGEQTHYEVKLFDAATADADDFDPNTSTPIETSGQVISRDTSYQLATVLPDGDYFTAVRVAQTVGEDLVWSDWSSPTGASFTIDVDLPGIPDITATARSADARIDLDCRPVNALSAAGAVLTPGGGRFENNITGWSATTGATISHNTTDAYSGTGSLQIDTDGDGPNEDAKSDVAFATPGRSYTLTARVKAPVGATYRVRLNELDDTDTELDHTTADGIGTGDWQKVTLAHTVGAGVGLEIKVGTDQVAQAIQLLVDLVNLNDASAAEGNGSFEVDLTGWNDLGTGTITRTRTDEAHKVGAFSQKVVVDGSAGNQGTRTDSFAMAASQTHTIRVYVKGLSGAGLRVQLQERTAADATVGSTIVNFTADGTWQLIEVVRAFGVTGVNARILVSTDGTAQETVFYLDGVTATEGPAVPTDAVHVQRTDDGGTTWTDIRTKLAGGLLGLGEDAVDQEAVNGGLVRYRARALSIHSAGPVYSAWAESDDVYWSSRQAYLKHAYKPWLSIPLEIASLPSRKRVARVTRQQPLGRACAVFLVDERGGAEGEVSFNLQTEEQQFALDTLLDEGVPLLLQTPAGAHWPDRWLIFGDHDRSRAADKAWIEDTVDALSWWAVPSPDGVLAGFSEFDPEEL